MTISDDDKIIIDIMSSTPVITGMMSINEIYGILKYLQYVLKNNIPGEIIEFGCFVGTVSIFIRKMLDKYNSSKEFHVYDSWEGLPEKHKKDETELSRQFNTGQFKVPRESFEKIFKHFKLTMPIIHEGLFKELDDSEYPDKIAFIFMDGDFYTSTQTALTKTYDKLQDKGCIIIDDCGWDPLPGPKIATDEFLQDKLEDLNIVAYPDKQLQFGKKNNGGVIIKGNHSINIESTISDSSLLNYVNPTNNDLMVNSQNSKDKDVSKLYKPEENILIYMEDVDDTENSKWVKSKVIQFVSETNKYELECDDMDEHIFMSLEPGGDNHFPML